MTAELPDREEQDAILSMRMDAMLSSSPASFLSLFGALFAVYVYWAPPTAVGLIVWSACIAAIAFANLASTILHARNLPTGWTAHSWARFVSVMHLLSGLTWGVGGGWMLSFADQHQALLTITIGLAAVTVSIPSVVHFPAYNLFHLPIFWSYAIGLVFSSLQFNWLIAIGFFLLGAFSWLIGRGLGDQLSNALRLSFENRRLAERLEERTAALEAANRELEIESHTDPLTGVANRRQLMTFARAVRGRCALLVVDIDHFKSYNDSFGHVEGDACLVAVAETLERSVRPNQDLVARLGGEEFAVILTDVSAEHAADMAERMRANVEKLHKGRKGGSWRLVTVSIGLSIRTSEQHKSLAVMMEEADAAVYRAKAGGRNLVCGDGVAQDRNVA
ncbi:MAG: GGDEF domain-containing protein [Rhizobiaceae bacterium]